MVNGFRIGHAFANGAFIETASPARHNDHTPRAYAWTDYSAVLVTVADRRFFCEGV